MMRLLSVVVMVVVVVGVQAAGFIGIFTSLLIWYIGLSILLTPDISYFALPVGDLSRRHSDLE
jgi:succinate-acetate transporter protein